MGYSGRRTADATAAFVCLAKIGSGKSRVRMREGSNRIRHQAQTMLIDTTVSGGKTFHSRATVLSLDSLNALINGINFNAIIGIQKSQ